MPIPEAARPNDTAATTQIEMRNVHFRLTEHIGIHVRGLRGELYSRLRDNATIVMGDKGAFGMRVYGGEAVITPVALTWLLNEWVFAHPDVPLKRVKVTGAGDQLRMTGLMGTREAGLPFEMLARVEATPDGIVRMVPTSIKAVRLETKGVMKALGVRMQDVLDLRHARGAVLNGNIMYLIPEYAFPPPVMRARIARAGVERGLLVLRFKPESRADRRRLDVRLLRDADARNFIAMRGGTVRFGKLYMVHTDATVLDADPKDPLDFYIDYYFTQMVEGRSSSQPDYGLVYTVPDYSDLRAVRERDGRTVAEGERREWRAREGRRAERGEEGGER